MGDLQNKQISQTYDALIQTGTDNPIDGTLRPLQDGSGNVLPMEVSTTGVNFTGTVTGIPASTDTTYTLDNNYFGSALLIELNGSDASTDSVAISPGTGINFIPTTSGIQIEATGGGGGGVASVHTNEFTFVGPSTGDTLEASALIPANTFSNGDTLLVRAFVDATNVTGWRYENFRISPNNTGTFDGVQLGTVQSPSPNYSNFQKTLYLQGDVTYWFNQDGGMEGGNTMNLNYDFANSSPIDWTTDQYLNYVIFIDGGTITIRDIIITKIA